MIKNSPLESLAKRLKRQKSPGNKPNNSNSNIQSKSDHMNSILKSSGKILTKTFYYQDPVIVAKSLIGKIIVRKN